MLTVVTTCNLEGWKLYGSRMLESFRQFWPNRTNIILYAEGFGHLAPAYEIRRLPAWHDEFKARHTVNPFANGMISGSYNFRRDCIRFSHKVAAFTDVVQSEGLLIWADADTLTHKPVDQGWLESLIPRTAWIAWLDRPGKYPECGFMIFRCDHPAHAEMLQRIREIYETDAVFDLPQTHDSFVVQQVVVQAVKEGLIPPPVSLSGPHKTNHPFASGPLSARMEHFKGSRKFIKGRVV